jgi:hypothetical protein
MKNLMLAILAILSLTAFATEKKPGDPVFISPRIFNQGTQFTLDLWNTTTVDIECRGTVWYSSQIGGQHFDSFTEIIYRGMNRSKVYRLLDWRDRIINVNENVRCVER